MTTTTQGAKERVQRQFSRCITDQQLAFLTMYICGEDHLLTDMELEIVSDVYTRGYNQAIRDVREGAVEMPTI